MLPKPFRQICPTCDMSMIVVAGFDREPDKQTHECLRCGHVELPAVRQPLRRTG